WAGVGKRRRAASLLLPPRPRLFGKTSASTSSTRPATSISRSRWNEAFACSMVRYAGSVELELAVVRRRGVRTGDQAGGGAAARDGVATGRQVQSPPHRLLQQDGQD